jgi:hypothetical protein
MNLEKINQHFYEGNLSKTEKTLYQTGYNFILNNKGTAEEAHQYGLKQIEKIFKLRKLANSGKIVKF